MSNPSRWHAVLVCVVLLSVAAGCQSASNTSEHEHDHEHAERPESLRVAIIELIEVRDQIRTAMDSNDTESAHDPLHKAGELLEVMPELAADTDLTESEWNEIKEEVDRLFDVFDEVDSAFHEEDSDRLAAYEGAKSAIDEGIAVLEAKLPLLDSDASHDGHEHSHDGEHGDHDEHEHSDKESGSDT